MFSTQVSEGPDAPAIIHAGTQTSYASLAELNERMASAVLCASSKVTPKVLIAVKQSVHAYAAMFGTLLTGGTFCPIDVNGPVHRNMHILQSFMPDVLLFDSSCPKIILDESLAVTHRMDVHQIPQTKLTQVPRESSEIAYVVFTSGSTGQPKGVKAARKAVSYVVNSEQQYYCVQTGDKWSQYSNIGYDMGIMDTLQALCHGATLIPITSSRDRLMPAKAIKESRLTIWQSVPSVLELMIQAKQISFDLLGSLRLMIFCGEPLFPQQLEVLFEACPGLTVFNAYGTTETTGFNTINRLTKENFRTSCASSAVAIGSEVQGWTVELCGEGAPDEGEIVVVGDNLSLGYWQDEEQTRAAFQQQRRGSEVKRAYHTGDYGRRIGSNLYCQGRLDRQVKIRGERIELDEIDHMLRQSGYTAAYSILHAGEVHSFVECESYVDEAQVRIQLRKELSLHGLPKIIKKVTSLPKNANGKVDRQKLERLASGGTE
ncbi:MAG: AMP-binding protein [Blastocatellia bacterium]